MFLLMTRSRRLVPAVLVVGRRQLEVLVVVGLGLVVVDRAARPGARRRGGGLLTAALLRLNSTVNEFREGSDATSLHGP